MMRFFKSCLWVLLIFFSVCSFSVAEDNWGTLNKKSYLAIQNDNYEDAFIFTKESLKIAQKEYGEHHLYTLYSMNNLAFLYMNSGQYESAESLYKKIIPITKKVFVVGNESFILTCMNNLAMIYTYQGKYQQAEKLYKNNLDIKKKKLGKKHSSTLLSMNNLAQAYHNQEKYFLAEGLYKETLSLYEEVYGEKNINTLKIMMNLATNYNGQKKHQLATEYLEKILFIFKETLGNNHSFTHLVMHNLAYSYKHENKYQLAESLYQEAFTLSKKIFGDEDFSTLIYMDSLAGIYHLQKKYQLAESLYQKSFLLNKQIFSEKHPNTLNSIIKLIFFYESQENYNLAEDLLYQMLRMMNKDLKELLWLSGRKSQENYIQRRRKYRNNYLSFYSFRNAPKEALYYSLSRKGLLLRIASEINTLSKKSTDPALKIDVEKLISLKNQLSAQAMLAFSGKSKKAIIDDLETQINDLEMELSQKVIGFKRSKTEVTPEEVQNKLKPNQALVDFLIYTEVDLKRQVYKKEQVIALVADKNEIKLIKLGELTLIETTLKKYRKMLYQGVIKNDIAKNKIIQKKITKLAKKLYQQIWQPLTTHLQNKTNVYIIPDGILHLLPFKALQTEKGDYLNSQYQLTQLASARDIVLPPLKGKSNPPAIFANPLYGEQTQTSNITSTQKREGLSFKRLDATQDEGKLLYNEMKKNQLSPELYTQQQATEEQIKKLHTPKILHLATHGFYLEDNKIEPPKNNEQRSINTPQAIKLIDNPLTRSGLALSFANDGLQGKREHETTDGILTALEVLALDLEGTDLVVLSACETGLGDIKIGEGVYSLNRAFQEAGAKSVLSTLWKISDHGTQKFMAKFYQYYLTGTPAQQALQKTQQDFIQNPDFNHPYYWAGFVMTGVE